MLSSIVISLATMACSQPASISRVFFNFYPMVEIEVKDHDVNIKSVSIEKRFRSNAVGFVLGSKVYWQDAEFEKNQDEIRSGKDITSSIEIGSAGLILKQKPVFSGKECSGLKLHKAYVIEGGIVVLAFNVQKGSKEWKFLFYDETSHKVIIKNIITGVEDLDLIFLN